MKPRFAAVWMLAPLWDNSDCTASYSRVCKNRAEAEQTLAALTEKPVAWNPNCAKSPLTFTEESDGVRPDIDFHFCLRS